MIIALYFLVLHFRTTLEKQLSKFYLNLWNHFHVSQSRGRNVLSRSHLPPYNRSVRWCWFCKRVRISIEEKKNCQIWHVPGFSAEWHLWTSVKWDTHTHIAAPPWVDFHRDTKICFHNHMVFVCRFLARHDGCLFFFFRWRCVSVNRVHGSATMTDNE